MFPISRISLRRLGSARFVALASAVVTVLAASAIIVGISSASVRSGGARAASAPPPTVRAGALPASSPAPFKPAGTIVGSSTLGTRVFINNSRGFALSSIRQGGGADYPAATVDGGKIWRVDGPELHRAAANAPDVVTQVGAAAPTTYFAYGGPGGGNSIAVTTDGGKHWWRAYLYGAVYAAVPFHTATGAPGLLAFVNAPGVYYSSDGGRDWHYRKSVFAVP
jgi:hypothetical protein